MLDQNALIAKSTTDAKINWVRDSRRRGERNTAPEPYRPIFEKLNNKWGLAFNDDRTVVPSEWRKKTNIKDKAKNCMATGKNLKYQLPKREFRKLKTWMEPGQEIQSDFFRKTKYQKTKRRTSIFIAIDRFGKWPTVKICQSSEAKEVLNFLKQSFNCYGLPEDINAEKRGAFVSKEYKEFCKSKNIEIEYSTPRLHTGTGAVYRIVHF